MQAVVPHSRTDPHYLVLRPHGGDACQALLDPRGAFVVELPDSMHVWQARALCRAWPCVIQQEVRGMFLLEGMPDSMHVLQAPALCMAWPCVLQQEVIGMFLLEGMPHGMHVWQARVLCMAWPCGSQLCGEVVGVLLPGCMVACLLHGRHPS